MINWCINAMILGWIGRWLYRGIRDGHIPIDWLVRRAETGAWPRSIAASLVPAPAAGAAEPQPDA